MGRPVGMEGAFAAIGCGGGGGPTLFHLHRHPPTYGQE